MSSGADILLIGRQDDHVYSAAASAAEKRGHGIITPETTADALKHHRTDGAEVVLLFLPLPDAGGGRVLNQIIARDPRAIVLVSGKDDELIHGADAVERGAYLYLTDPTNEEELLAALGLALGARQSDAELRYLRRKDAEGSDWQSIVGRSAGMRAANIMVRKICRRTMMGGSPPVLITGETGTGKGLFAKAIHYNSIRRGRAFVELNIAAVPATLLEAELFGHERGAFTDAHSARAGLFEVAHQGTLFLDEIGAMPLELQAKLLSVVEECSIRRLGGNEPKPIDVQLVTATSRDVEAMTERGEFADDLYHRLNVVRIELPPLRERGEDKLLLAETFLESLCRDYGLPIKRLNSGARRAIDRYPWPGNVRELRNCLERLVLLEDEISIKEEQLRIGTRRSGGSIRGNGSSIEIVFPAGGLSLDEVEREIIRKALERAGGNLSRAARLLSISRDTLVYRVRKHGLSENETKRKRGTD